MPRLWPWVLLGLVALDGARGRKRFRPQTYPGITNKTFIGQYVDIHNRLRSEVQPQAADMLHMTWDLALARTARAWGQKCIFQHNYFMKEKGAGHPDPKLHPVGENIWFGPARRVPFNSSNAIYSWYSDKDFYDYQDNSCSQVCRHYKQVVRASTYKVGCAVVFCRRLDRHRNTEYFVCNYGPTDTYPSRPYKTGQPCSACPEGDTCQDHLCRNSSRDKIYIKRYSRWYPPWEHNLICDDSCIVLAVLRPSLTLLAFVTVYCLQKCYPDLMLQTETV
uniref:GLIPR1-like protein 1 isoform X1 n=1 Tax=Podarcis muralis TaxID=64176 RepID=UPI00109F2D9C|nr:GLIPR1-like protein 1 isoform X1 [Podarcis muralis]